VLILTTFDLDSEIVAALNAGASGYLLKDIDPGDISIAIEKAAKGGTYLPPEISSKAIAAMRNPGPKLTRREREVVKLLATGASNAQIAQELFVTEATVKSHLVNVFTKLGVDSRARAIRVAEDRGPGLSPRLVQDAPGPRRRLPPKPWWSAETTARAPWSRRSTVGWPELCALCRCLGDGGSRTFGRAQLLRFSLSG
jgi:DNA-binding CsgD family transcriptional regulator